MKPFSEEDLTAALHELRPTASLAFAAELDERVAAGFPRAQRRPRRSPARFVRRLRAPSRRRLAFATGAMTLVVAAVIAGVLVEQGSDQPRKLTFSRHAAAENFNYANPTEASRAAAGSASNEALASRAPKLSASPKPSTITPFANGVKHVELSTGFYDGSDSYGHRAVERTTEVRLGAAPDDLGRDAARVYEAVHANHGVVQHSSVYEDPTVKVGGRFELLIPSARLGDALAAISAIDRVRSRSQLTTDVTAPLIGLRERLRDSQAKVTGLLGQLAAAETDAERATAEAELRPARRHAAILRAQLSHLKHRANYAHVRVLIEADHSGAASGGGWGPGDALGDAGQVLGVLAGVAIVALAIGLPLALIALAAWIARRAWVRRRRERALG